MGLWRTVRSNTCKSKLEVLSARHSARNLKRFSGNKTYCLDNKTKVKKRKLTGPVTRVSGNERKVGQK